MDFTAFRDAFPALKRLHRGETLVFMDGPGGTQVPTPVIKAISNYYERSNANLHGAFITSQESDQVIDEARQKMATFLNAEGPANISIGQNMTTLNYALAHAMGRWFQPGDEIVITQLDHEANRSPWLSLRKKGIIVKEVALQKNGYLDYGDLARKMNHRTRLVAMGYSSNILGTVNNVAVAREQAYRVGAWLLLDAVHYAPHYPIDVQAIDCDFLLCSAYKFYGPHLGFLYAKSGCLDQLPTDCLRTAPQAAPGKIETGTLNHAAIAGVSAAVDFLAAQSEADDYRSQLVRTMQQISQHERALLEQLHAGLSEVKGLSLLGPQMVDNRRSPTLALRMTGHSPQKIAEHLAQHNICAWNGHFYALRASEVMGWNASGGVVRLGLSAYSNVEDVNRVIEVFQLLAKA